MSLQTFTYLRQRVNYLIGDTSNTTSASIDSHINSAINDILNAYQFSWNTTVASTAISGSSPYYTFNLASDYNPLWHIGDARIQVAGVGGDKIFTEIVPQDRDYYASQTYRYYLTYDTTNHVYVFNTPESSGTVTYLYNFIPSDLSAGTDICIIPDAEAVCYLAASKNWVTDERDQGLGSNYKQEATSRIQSMWQKDLAFGPVPSEGTIIDFNGYLSNQ